MISDIQDFGKQLIKTGDLDPVYIGLHGLNLDQDRLSKWLMAYWCFYHAGVACYMAQFSDHRTYWHWMETAAWNEKPSPVGGRWPRAAERRHFRGQKCVEAVSILSVVQNPTQSIRSLYGNTNKITETLIMERIQHWPLFGPWIAFKAADMLERCAGVPVQFDPNIGLMYEEPAAALRMLVSEYESSRTVIYQNLLDHFHSYRAPPNRLRPCGPQEVETILCKWKSHMTGGYWVGKDIHEVRRALNPRWGELATKMLAAMPAEETPGHVQPEIFSTT